MQAGYTGFDKRLKYLFDNATEVSAAADYSSGTRIGTITIDGQALHLYIPSSGGSTVTYNEGLQSGTLVGTLTIDGVPHNLYCTAVEANPAGSATGTLTKLGIDGTVYELSGGGGAGGGISVDTLYNRTSYPSSSSGSGQERTYTLSGGVTFDDYDAIYVMAWGYWNKNSGYEGACGILILKDDYYKKPTTDPSQYWSFVINSTYANQSRMVWFTLTNSTTLKSVAESTELNNEPIIFRIYGLKFGVLHTYSTTQQEIGTWVNGDTLYEICVPTGGSAPTGATVIDRISKTGYDVIQYTL